MKGCIWYLFAALIVMVIMYWGVIVLGNLFICVVDLFINLICLIINTLASLWMAILI